MNELDKWIYVHEKCIEKAFENLLEKGKLQEIMQKASVNDDMFDGLVFGVGGDGQLLVKLVGADDKWFCELVLKSNGCFEIKPYDGDDV